MTKPIPPVTLDVTPPAVSGRAQDYPDPWAPQEWFDVTVIVAREGQVISSTTLTGTSPTLLLDAAAAAVHHGLLLHPDLQEG